MTTETTNVPLTPSQIQFLMDLMMGCLKTKYSEHQCDDANLYNHLDSFLKQ